jgi:GNAT superfamily N-acetyltransferase
MRQFEVRRLTEHDWQVWREVRLAALRDSPDAFYSTLEQEQAYDEAKWRDLVKPAWGVKVVSLADDSPVGAVGAYVSEEVEGAVELFGMWVSPAARGTGVSAEPGACTYGSGSRRSLSSIPIPVTAAPATSS